MTQTYWWWMQQAAVKLNWLWNKAVVWLVAGQLHGHSLFRLLCSVQDCYHFIAESHGHSKLSPDATLCSTNHKLQNKRSKVEGVMCNVVIWNPKRSMLTLQLANRNAHKHKSDIEDLEIAKWKFCPDGYMHVLNTGAQFAYARKRSHFMHKNNSILNCPFPCIHAPLMTQHNL